MPIQQLPAPLSSTDQPGLRISGARKFFRRSDGTSVPAIDGIDLDVEPGSFVVLLGPSGCGKTTLLRSIAGLEQLDEGVVQRSGVTLFDSSARIDLPPERRRVSMMFQSYALWPHLSVAQNVGYPLRARKIDRRRSQQKVQEILRIVGIGELADQYPTQISGGQQQRVALARALVSDDGVVLFDEPLSNVDARVRDHLRGELRRLHAELGFTAVYVTHDQDEALALATTVTVLESGRVAQSAPPREVYATPRSAYVARFLGTVNELAGRVVRLSSNDVAVVETDIGEIHGRAAVTLQPGDRVTVFSRPETWKTVIADDRAGANRWAARSTGETFHGFYTDHDYLIGETPIKIRSVDPVPVVGEHLIGVAEADVQVLPTPPAPGHAASDNAASSDKSPQNATRTAP